MTNDGSLLLQLIFLFVLIGTNAFFASSEIAIISLNDKKIKRMAEDGDKKAKMLYGLIGEPSKFLATIQVGVTLSGLLASAFAAESFADRITTWFMTFNYGIDASIIKVVSLFLITITLSYFTLVFGELVPKRVAMQKPEPIAMLSIRPLLFVLAITSPFVKLLTFSTNFIIKLFGGNPNASEENVTEEEIRMMVDLGEEKGVIQESEKQMIENIFEFDNKGVTEIMTHRKDISGLSIDSDLDEIMAVIASEKFTRFPVYKDTIDNVIGILHVKDLILYLNGKNDREFEIKNILRSAYFVPTSKITDELFAELQKSKQYMAIVIDEYGGTAGLVTIEDLLEEIVGNIFDEYDEEEKEYEKIDENTFILNGTCNIDIFKKLFDLELPEGEEYDTISGFLISELGRIPKQEEKPIVEHGKFVFKVLEVGEKRIERVKVCRTGEEDIKE